LTFNQAIVVFANESDSGGGRALASEWRGSKLRVNCVNPGHTATAFNDYRSTKPVAREAAVIVKYALLGEDGVNGRYLSEEGQTPW